MANMLNKIERYSGSLIDGELEHQVEIRPASDHSIFIQFLSDVQYANEQRYSDLIFKTNQQEHHLGPCHLLVEPNIDELDGRIIFKEKIYDFKQLFTSGKIITVGDTLQNLPVVLSHKDDILPVFKEFAADLNYDLNVFREHFDRIDSDCHSDPLSVQSAVQQVLIDQQGDQIIAYLDNKLAQLGELVASFGADENQRHGYFFRKQLWNIIKLAPIMARANLKPRGYAGDSEMMAMIYNREYLGDTSFAKILSKYAIEHAASKAVRSRRDLIADMLARYLCKQGKSEQQIKILSIACGPAYEIHNILCDSTISRRYHFTLLDQDPRALQEAAGRIHKQEILLNTRIEARYVNESVRTMIFGKDLEKKWGQFDFIYSMGLFDYLTPPVAKILMKKMFDLLKPNGELIVGNYHINNPSKIYMEYWLDWVLYYRTESEFKALLQDTPDAQTKINFEDTGSQMFLHAEKKG